MRVWHLNCGTMAPRGGRWINGEGGLCARARLVCHVLVVETEAGLVLVDSGYGEADVRGRSAPRRARLRAMGAQLKPAETAVEQLAGLGFARDDVRHVILTHLDFDHAGGLADFPRAEVHLLADEHEAATAPRTFKERMRYDPRTWSHRPRWALHRADGERWFGFEAVRQLQGLPPELLLLPLAGHTRGHACVAVETDDGWLLHAGDAYFFAGEMNPQHPWCTPGLSAFQRAFAHDDERRLHNQERLRELVASRGDAVRVFSAHDPSELAALQVSSPMNGRAPRP